MSTLIFFLTFFLIEHTLEANWHEQATDFSLFSTIVASNADIATDTGGGALAVWVEHSADGQQIITSSLFRQTWKTPQAISEGESDGSHLKKSPKIAMDATGTAIILYGDSKTDKLDAVLWNGVSWTSLKCLAEKGTNAVIAMNGLGNGLAAWHDEKGIKVSFYKKELALSEEAISHRSKPLCGL